LFEAPVVTWSISTTGERKVQATNPIESNTFETNLSHQLSGLD